MNEPLRTTLADVVSFLDAERVPYALIGGLAASLRGRPRATVDVDMVIQVDLPRAIELLGVLDNSSFRPLFADPQEVVERSLLLPLRHRTTNVKVDLALGLSGFEHQLVARAERVDLAGMPILVATAEDLILMKVLAGRPQDEQDLIGIAIAQGEHLDWNYCLKLAAELGEAIGQDLVGRVRLLQNTQDDTP